MKYIRSDEANAIIDAKNYKRVEVCDIARCCSCLDVLYVPVNAMQADTIEELCDCFVEVGLGNPMVVTWDYVLHDDDRRNFDVYGAISTAKGIIYVAKLNDEGELELL